MSDNAKKAPPRPAEGSPRPTVAGKPVSKLEIALALAKLGFNVFPITPNSKKPPLINNWPNLATNDARQIKEWWGTWPDANVGICTTGLCVVDVDTKSGGHETFKSLLDEIMLLGEPVSGTWTSKTPSGGLHLIFSMPRGVTVANSASHVCKGVDIRGENGYIVAPGSTIGDGVYAWKPATVDHKGYAPADRPLAEAPAWLIALCKKPVAKSAAAGVRIIEEDEIALARADEWLRRFAPEATEGNRNDTAFKVAARLYDEGISRESCMERMLSWNETNCHPSLELHEIESVVQNAETKRANAVGCKHPLATGFNAVQSSERAALSIAPAKPINFEDPADLFAGYVETPLPDVAAVLSPLVATYVKDEAERKGVDPWLVCLCTVVSAAGATSQRVDVQVKQHDSAHKTKPVKWGVISGEPSTRKSAPAKEAARRIAANEKPWAEQYKKERRSYELAHAAWKAASREGQATSEPIPPVRRRKLVHNATTEALAIMLQDQKSGLFQFADELDGWFGGMDAYRQGNKRGSVDQPFWLGAKDGASHTTDRVGRESVFVESVAISVLGGIQPSVIGPMIDNLAGNGMLPRFDIFVAGKAKQGLDRVPHPAGEIIERAFGVLMNMDFPAEAPTLTFTPEADKVRQEFLAVVHDKIDDPDAPRGVVAYYGKSENEMARTAAVLHMLDFAVAEAMGQNTQSDDLVGDTTIDQDPLNASIRRDGVFGENVAERLPLQISEETARRACRYMVDFQFPQQIKFYREVAGANTDVDFAVKRTASYILRNELTQITERRVQQSITGLKNGTAEQIRKRHQTLQILVMNGWLEPESTHSVKGHPNKFTVNPAVHDGRFAHIKAEETARCEKAQAEIAREAETRRFQRQVA